MEEWFVYEGEFISIIYSNFIVLQRNFISIL